jgi:hypothetical protein
MEDAQRGATGFSGALLLTLPAALQRRVWLALPVRQRLRCREVCAAFRDALGDASLWTALHFRPLGNSAVISPALLRAACARTGGQLRALDLCLGLEAASGVRDGARFSRDDVLAVAAANAATLRHLTLEDGHAALTLGLHTRGPPCAVASVDDVRALIRVAPALSELRVAARCLTLADASALLRADKPELAPLRLVSLFLTNTTLDGVTGFIAEGWDLTFTTTDAAARALAADLSACAPLRSLSLRWMVFDMRGTRSVQRLLHLVADDEALRNRLSHFCVHVVYLPPASVAALARLAAGHAMAHFHWADGMWINDAPERPPQLGAADVAPLCAALAESRSLRRLTLPMAVQGTSTLLEEALAALIRSLVGHPTLSSVVLVHDGVVRPHAPPAMADELVALVAADAAALRSLVLPMLGGPPLLQLLAALRANTHLRELSIELPIGRPDQAEALVREWVLPAVAANTSLRRLTLTSLVFGARGGPTLEQHSPAVQEALQLVAARST